MKNKTLIAAMIYAEFLRKKECRTMDKALKDSREISEEICKSCGDDPEAEIFPAPIGVPPVEILPTFPVDANISDCGNDINDADCPHAVGDFIKGVPCCVEVRMKA